MQVNNAKQLLTPRPIASEYGRVPKGDVVKVGENTYQTYRYRIEVKNGEVTVFDLKTKTNVRAWGDPHLHTSDGDKMQFHKNNVTLDLEDGTKITLKPTAPNAQGISLVDGVQILTPKGGAEVTNISGPGGPKGQMYADSAKLDRAWADGTVLEARGEVDDLFLKNGGKELTGGDPTQQWGEHLLDGKGGKSDISFDRPIPQLDLRQILSLLQSGLRGMSPEQLKQLIGRINDLIRGGQGQPPSNPTTPSNPGTPTIPNFPKLTIDQLRSLLGLHNKATQEVANTTRGSGDFNGQMQGMIGGLNGEINALKQKLSDPNLSSEERTMIQMELQEKMQERMQLINMLTSLSKTEHEEKMAIIRNLRVSG